MGKPGSRAKRPRTAAATRRSPTAESCLLAWLELVEQGVEFAVAGIVAPHDVSREEALRRIGQRIREDVERDTPAILDMARGMNVWERIRATTDLDLIVSVPSGQFDTIRDSLRAAGLAHQGRVLTVRRGVTVAASEGRVEQGRPIG